MNAAAQTMSLLPEETAPVASLPPADWLDVLPPQADMLRPYQREVMAKTAVSMRRTRRILVQAPTGAGKTHLFAVLSLAAMLYGLRVLILATRTRLVRQIHERLDGLEVPHGILAAAMPGYTAWSRPVQIASVDTLYRRCVADKRMPLPVADVVVFDEAHLALGASRSAILDAYPKARIFGFTATPAKTSGACLREQFDELVMGPSIHDLIALGALVKPRIFAKPVISAQGLKRIKRDSKTGDYATGALSETMSRPKLIGDVVSNWLRIANGKRTLVFACDKAHGACLVQEFRQAGVAAELLTDADDESVREAAIARLEAGITHVLVNCFLLSYGIDIPAVEAVVLARPTRSVVLMLQAVGRGMRPSPGKDHVILIDHGRVFDSLGLPTYDRDWSLDGSNVNQAAEAKLAETRKSGDEFPRTCSECSCMWVVSDDGHSCPNCGWTPLPRPRAVLVQDAELAESSQTLAPTQDLEPFFRQACGWYRARWPQRWAEKPKSGRWWAWMQTREKFKRPDDERMPSRFWELAPVEPEAVAAGYFKSQVIRYAKGRAKAGTVSRETSVTANA